MTTDDDDLEELNQRLHEIAKRHDVNHKAVLLAGDPELLKLAPDKKLTSIAETTWQKHIPENLSDTVLKDICAAQNELGFLPEIAPHRGRVLAINISSAMRTFYAALAKAVAEDRAKKRKAKKRKSEQTNDVRK